MDTLPLLAIIFVVAGAVAWLAIKVAMNGFNIYHDTFTSNAESNLEKMFLFFDIRKMFFTNVAMIFGLPLLVYFISGGNAFYSVLTVIGVLVAPKIVLNVMAKRRTRAILVAMPDALAQIAGSMKSGSTFTSSVQLMVEEMKGPITQEFGMVIKENKLGITMKDALENLAERVDLEEMDLVVTATLISRDVGGNLSETFERLSDMLRKKIEMEAKIVALTSQGKMQGYVVAMLPFGIVGALTAVDPQSIMPIFSTYLGWGFLGVILILELLGGMMIRKIVNIDV